MDGMNAAFEWVVGGSMLGLVIFSIKTYNDVNAKVSRQYQRLDEVKKDNEEKFVNKDVCKILHEQMQRDITEIKIDVKSILNRGRDQE